jgi:hypothetical protein
MKKLPVFIPVIVIVSSLAFAQAQMKQTESPQIQKTEPRSREVKPRQIPKVQSQGPIGVSLGGATAFFVLEGGSLVVSRSGASNTVHVPVSNGQLNLQHLVDALGALGFSQESILSNLGRIVRQLETRTGLSITGKDQFARYL